MRDCLPASPQALEVEITLVVKSSFSCELPISELYGLQYIRSTEFSAVRRLVLEAQRLPAFLFIVRLRSTARHQTFFRLSKSDVVSFHCIPQKQFERSRFFSCGAALRFMLHLSLILLMMFAVPLTHYFRNSAGCSSRGNQCKTRDAASACLTVSATSYLA